MENRDRNDSLRTTKGLNTDYNTHPFNLGLITMTD